MHILTNAEAPLILLWVFVLPFVAPFTCLFPARPPHFTRHIVVLFPHSSKSGEDIAEVHAWKILGPVVEGDLTFGVHREGITSTSGRHSSRNLSNSHLALIIFTMITTFVPLSSPFLTKKTLMRRSFSRQCAPCRYNNFHQASTPLTYWSFCLFGPPWQKCLFLPFISIWHPFCF